MYRHGRNDGRLDKHLTTGKEGRSVADNATRRAGRMTKGNTMNDKTQAAPVDVLAADRSNLTELAAFFPEARLAPSYTITRMSERCWAYSGPGFCGTRPTKEEAESAALAKFGGAA